MDGDDDMNLELIKVSLVSYHQLAKQMESLGAAELAEEELLTITATSLMEKLEEYYQKV